MKVFLLEIFSEEVPSKMQLDATSYIENISHEILSKNGITITKSQIQAFCSPRRLTLTIKDLEDQQMIPSSKKIGPKIDADPKAINGFLKANNLNEISQLDQVKQGNNIHYVYNKKESLAETALIIKESLPLILQKMIGFWPKIMRYDVGKLQVKWIRPVRNLLCLFGCEIIDFEFFGLKSNNFTYGHFLHSINPIKILDSQFYFTELENNFVIANHKKRRELIVEKINKITKDLNLDLIDNENSYLFDEVNGLCELPESMVGTIDEKFMDLPEEILILTLKLNQKYFCLRNKDGKISRNFIFISNAVASKQNQQKIIYDNEKIVRARLEDAEFFIKEDLKIELENRFAELKNIIFHKKLGNIFEKCERIEFIAEYLSIWISHCDISLIKELSFLCKADLTTKAVAEFPELQGKIGSFYSQKQGKNSKISAAIYEHYLPIGINSELPITPLGAAISICDKIDNIVGLFLAGEKPSSSKDPYAIRRAALGIIRICLEYKIKIPLRILIERGIKSYKPKLLEKLLNDLSANQTKITKKDLIKDVENFFIERFKNLLKEHFFIKQDLLNELFNTNHEIKYLDFVTLANKAIAINSLLDGKEKNIIALYKRISNVLSIEEKNDNRKFDSKPHILLMKNKEEKALYKKIKSIKSIYIKSLKKSDFETAISQLRALEIDIDNFFSNIIINDENKKLRENRLLILGKIRKLFLMLVDFSKIEI